MTADPLVSLVGITKSFGGVHALKGVDLSIYPGEVVALVGHNGAGKSVLVQILSGVFPPTSGEIRIGGRAVQWCGARSRGHGEPKGGRSVMIAARAAKADTKKLVEAGGSTCVERPK